MGMEKRTFHGDLERELKDPEFARLFEKAKKATERELKWGFRIKRLKRILKFWERNERNSARA